MAALLFSNKIVRSSYGLNAAHGLFFLIEAAFCGLLPDLCLLGK
jgi:hypothetical protein